MQIMCYFCIVIKKIKIMEKHYLTVEQMNNLQKIGLDCSKASFRYERQADEDDEGHYIFEPKWHLEMGYNDSRDCQNWQYMPCFDLQDMLDILPVSINDYEEEVPLNITVNTKTKEYEVSYYLHEVEGVRDEDDIYGVTDKNLIDAVYIMLTWWIKNKKLCQTKMH